MLPWVFDHLNILWNSFDWAKAANLAVILAGLFTYFKVVKPMLRGVARFLEDWNGEAPRNGIIARPGVMLRMQRLEEEMDLVLQSEAHKHRRLLAVEAENRELKAAVKRIENMVKPVYTYVKESTGVHATVPAARSESK